MIRLCFLFCSVPLLFSFYIYMLPCCQLKLSCVGDSLQRRPSFFPPSLDSTMLHYHQLVCILTLISCKAFLIDLCKSGRWAPHSSPLACVEGVLRARSSRISRIKRARTLRPLPYTYHEMRRSGVLACVYGTFLHVYVYLLF